MSTKKPTNDLVSRLGVPSVNPYANRCSIGLMLSSLNSEEQTAVESALERVSNALKTKTSLQSGYTAKWLAQILSDAGYNLSDRMIRRHCHGDCSCES